MPKTNHNRNFTDERDYTTVEGDWTCGAHGAARNRRGCKKGYNGIERTTQNQAVRQVLKNDEMELVLPIFGKRVPDCHDHNGKTIYPGGYN